MYIIVRKTLTKAFKANDIGEVTAFMWGKDARDYVIMIVGNGPVVIISDLNPNLSELEKQLRVLTPSTTAERHGYEAGNF